MNDIDPRAELTAPERAALDAWSRVSPDTTGMLYAVRHAIAEPLRDLRETRARLANAEKERDGLYAALAEVGAERNRLRAALAGPYGECYRADTCTLDPGCAFSAHCTAVESS